MDLIHACRAKSSESLAVIEQRLMYKAERDSVRLDSLFLNGRSHLHAIHRGTSLTIQVPLSSRDPLPNGILRKLLKDLVGRVGSHLRPAD